MVHDCARVVAPWRSSPRGKHVRYPPHACKFPWTRGLTSSSRMASRLAVEDHQRADKEAEDEAEAMQPDETEGDDNRDEAHAEAVERLEQLCRHLLTKYEEVAAQERSEVRARHLGSSRAVALYHRSSTTNQLN